jgi:hypothetical protein
MNDATNTQSEARGKNLSVTISVDQTPEQVFEAINQVRSWWSGDIEGRTDQLGAEFTYRYEDLHYSRQRIVELVSGKRIVWLVVDSALNFVSNKQEWNGTKVSFDIARRGDKTEVRFTHEGLVPSHECFSDCSSAWGSYITGSLRNFISKGRGQPNAKPTARGAA